MAFDFNKLKKSVQESAEGLLKSVTEATENIPESLKDINVADSVKDLAEKSQNAVSNLTSKGLKSFIPFQNDKQSEQQDLSSDSVQLESKMEIVLPIRDSLRVLYCLMIADGTVSEEETEKLYEIGQELDPDFASYQADLIEEGTRLMNLPYVDMDEYYDNIHDQVSSIMHAALEPKEDGIRGKLLLWDLLAVAYSDGEYSSNERRLIRYIAKCAGVDNTTLLEMEQTLRTLLAIEEEENWLKNTARTYAVVEERMNELTERKNTIMMGVHALLTD